MRNSCTSAQTHTMTVKRVRLPIVLTVALALWLMLPLYTHIRGWRFTPLAHLSLDAACLLCALSAIRLHFYFARLFRQHVALSQALSENDRSERELTHDSEMLQEANNEMDAILHMAVGVSPISGIGVSPIVQIETERQRLRTLIDLLPVGICITHSSSGAGSLINRKGIELLGDAIVHETGALGYSSTYNLCRPDGQPYPLEELPLHRTLSTGEPTEAHDVVLYHPDGREILLWIQAAPLKDKAGRVTGAISVYHDVTEHERDKRSLKHYAEMLEEANHGMDAILQSMAAGVLTVDAQGYVTTFNSAAEEILGIPRQEAIGRHCADVLGPDCGWGGVCQYNSGTPTAATSDHPLCLPCVAERVTRSEPYDNREQTIRRLDGRPVILNVRTTPLRRQDQVIGAVKIFYDVTLLKEAQKAQAAMRAQNQFLSTMSHELRTPLNSILALSQLLLEQSANGGAQSEPRRSRSGVDADQRECLEVIHRNGQHLLRLINDLMDLTKIEAGKVEVQTSEFSFKDVLEWVLASVTPLAQKKGLLIQCASPDDLPRLYTDEKKVNQILFNLLSNAIKFTDAGGRITVSAEVIDGQPHPSRERQRATSEPRASASLRVAVADTGIGIPAHQIPLVFERFRQLDEGMARKYDGAGLGLTISKSLVELLGGRIQCDSVLGSGSIFTFEIPIRYPHAAAPPTDEAKSDSTTALTESSHPQKKILI